MRASEGKIAIYSRKSKFTGKGESIGNQIELCREYIRANHGQADADAAAVYEDEGFSGGNLERPAFKRMLRAARERKFKAVVVYRLDRISRNISDFSGLIEELSRLDIAFVSIKEQFDTGTPMGRAMMYIASVFSQLERETIAERIRDNMHELAKTGRWLGGTTPTGYCSKSVRTVTVDGKAKKACMLELIPEEGETVKLVYTLFAETHSLTATETELLRLAYALERRSEHPLAKAVLRRAEADGLTAAEVADFQALPGNGLRATLDGQPLCGGNADFIRTAADIPAPMQAQAQALAEAGKTPLFFARGGELLGIVAVADVLKPDSPQAIRELRNMGIRVVMITGDNARTARAIGAQAGVDEVIAGVLPDGKEREIRRLSARGKVAMVGDGINDAPALTRADIGIAIGAGTDVAIDAADVVLVNSHLSDVPAAIRLSRATLRNIHENLFWAFFYNTIGIPIAAGVFVPLGLTLNPMIGAAAMSLSSFCVVTNALRLNLFKLRDTRHDHKRANHLKEVPEIKEETAMKKTIQIEGMMCAHCEATVKKALEALPEVTEAAVSHTAGTAVVTLSAPVDDAVLKSTVEAKDYKVTGIA